MRVTVSILPTTGPGADAFNGDLYVFLQHGSGFVVLVNRPGRTPGDDFGYDDDGLVITFDDTAPNGDFHAHAENAHAHSLPSSGLSFVAKSKARLTDPT